MNEKINDFSKQSTQADKPATLIVTDQDGNPIEVEFIGPAEVQDTKYTDEKVN